MERANLLFPVWPLATWNQGLGLSNCGCSAPIWTAVVFNLRRIVNPPAALVRAATPLENRHPCLPLCTTTIIFFARRDDSLAATLLSRAMLVRSMVRTAVIASRPCEVTW